MNNSIRKNVLLSLVLTGALLFDGAVSAFFQPQLIRSFGTMVPRLTIIVLLMYSFYLPPKQVVYFSLVFGFVYDSYYSGVLGLYTAYFTIMTSSVSQIKNIFFPNMFMIGMVGMISLSAVETFVYITYQVISVTNLTMMEFMAQRLGATLILNALFFIVFYYPLKKFLSHVLESEI